MPKYKFCIKCGEKLPLDAIFCPYCGTKQPDTAENETANEVSSDTVEQEKAKVDNPVKKETIKKAESTNPEPVKAKIVKEDIEPKDTQPSKPESNIQPSKPINEQSSNSSTDEENEVSRSSQQRSNGTGPNNTNQSNRNKWLIIISGLIVLFAIIFGIASCNRESTEPPKLDLNTYKVKITGTNTKGKLTGTTSPNTRVTAKDVDGVSDDIDVKSNNKGKFTLKRMDDTTTYKIQAKNEYGKSKKEKVEVSDIPDSAYTPLHITGENSMGALSAKKDEKTLDIKGTAPVGSKVRIYDDQNSENVIKTIKIGKSGKWSATVSDDGKTDKEAMYTSFTIKSKIKGLLESQSHDVIFDNANYDKNASNDDSDTDSNKDHSTNDSSKNASSEDKAALKSAKDYSDNMSMSKAGIYDQLTSTYGEGFPAEAAQYAIDNVKADWNKNALKSAQSYRDDMSMSDSEIYDQLTSTDGEGFTPDQANYAVQNLK